MQLLKITGIITGFIIATLLFKKCVCKNSLLKNPEKRYNIDDLLIDEYR